MVFRLSAAICGAVITLAISVAMARSEIGAVQSNAIDNAASGATVVGAASMYNPYRPGWRELRLDGRQPSLRPQARRPLSK